MSTHTPGPWTAHITRDYVQRISPRKTIGPFGLFNILSGDGVVASYSHSRDPRPLTEQEEADAKLIAAAPDMADAGRRALDVMERSYLNPESVDLQELLAVIEIQRAALAKAGVL